MVKKKITEEKALGLVIIGLVIVVIFLYSYVNSSELVIEKKYSVDLIEITGGCEGCFDLSGIIMGLVDSGDIEIKSRKTLEYDSNDAKVLIEKYGIEKVPVLIITSKKINEIPKISEEGIFYIDGNSAIFDNSVPYRDLFSGEINGIVNVKEIYDSSCEDCMPLTQFGEYLGSLQIKIGNYDVLEFNSEEGKTLINENDLKFVPTVLVSKEIESYWWIFPKIKDYFIENDKYYLFNRSIAPYVELSSGKVKGVVDITYLVNESCEDCFDAVQLKSSFGNLGVFINNEVTVDISSVQGKKILKDYNVTAVPTVILSKGILDYGSIKKTLDAVGTFEDDGKFVFRNLDSLNVKYQEVGDNE